MSRKLKFKLSSKGVKKLLKSDEVKALLDKKATVIASRCGDGYKHDIYPGRFRSNAMIFADTYKAKKDNSENNTILKALR